MNKDKISILGVFKDVSVYAAIYVAEVVTDAFEVVCDKINGVCWLEFTDGKDNGIYLSVPKGIEKDEWKNLVFSKSKNIENLKEISNAHLNLSLWYHGDLVERYTPQESIILMCSNDIPSKYALAETELFGKDMTSSELSLKL